jgi:rod shape-determining protein MreD
MIACLTLSHRNPLDFVNLMNWISPFLVLMALIFFIPAQTFLLEGIEISGVKPDLGFIFSYLIGLAWGKKGGGIWGCLLGGLQDFFSIGRLGLNCLLKGFIGFGTGLLEAFFLYFSLEAHAFVILCASLLHDMVGEMMLRGVWEGIRSFSLIMVGQAVYNCVVAMVFLYVLSRQSHSGEPWIEKIAR